MPRKILFVLFAEDGCRQNHCFKYALDLDGHAGIRSFVDEGYELVFL